MKLTSLAILLGLTMGTSLRAAPECKQIKAEIVDQDTGDKGYMIVGCHKGAAKIPDRNTLTFINWKNGELCTAVKECTQIRKWNAEIGVKAEFEYEATLEAIEDLNFEFEGKLTLPELELTLEYGVIDTHCKPLRKFCRNI
ncbi:MAG: hypothetical protein HRU19_01560 [Pseudobacteriovorax sp.]|nr:hypothetical protein [Pseudobacteriovorax sp.]